MGILDDKSFLNHVSIECVIFGYENNQIKILISKLKYKGDFYSLPAGFIYLEEDCEDAAKRILVERTAISKIHMEQFKIFGKADRKNKAFFDKLIELNYPDEDRKKNDPIYKWVTNRFISIGFYALVNIQEVKPQITEIDESFEWYTIDEIPNMIMDHNEIIKSAYQSLKENIDITLSAFKLLPEKFTIAEVQEIYETIFEKTFIRTNFQKKILDKNVLERLEKKFTGAQNKAPYLYKFKD